jgi:hypothetical protein
MEPLTPDHPDARLIAAAPELLEALENLENDDGHIPASIWAKVQSAIAKARALPKQEDRNAP